jgi:hypothetical protein
MSYFAMLFLYSHLAKWSPKCSHVSSYEIGGIFHSINSATVFVPGVSLLQLGGF